MSQSEIEQWICRYLRELVGVGEGDLDRDRRFDKMGLDSASAVALVGDIEDQLGIEIDPTLPYDHPTIASLAGKLAELRALQVAAA